MHSAQHHFVSARDLRLAAADAGVSVEIAMRVAVGVPVTPAERDQVVTALRARGVDIDQLPAARREPSPLAGRIPTTTARSTTE
jgi:hypothetical protein